MTNQPLRFAVIGTGFWSNYQIAAWQELEGVSLVALYNRTLAKAVAIGEKFGVTRIYDNVDDLLNNETLDFVDIITDVATHPAWVTKAAQKGVDVVCQKPMAPSLLAATQMVEACAAHGVKFFIHENFRWQAPFRRLKAVLDSGVIGRPFKGRLSFCSAFPVFDNQPFLAEEEQFIIADVGSHVLDITRYLFGEAETLYCLTNRIHPHIKGEDVANVLMKMENGVHCFAEMSYASRLEKESFPQTLALIEGEHGSVELSHNFLLKITTRAGTVTETVHPRMYSWVDPDYAVVHSSIVDCNQNILQGLRGGQAETTGQDNYQTVRLVYAAYESARTGKVISLNQF